jgi:XapX domain-containing protein
MMTAVAKGFAISFAVGIGVGLVYAVLRVKSPAPPIIALVGLLGMVSGEQLPAWVVALQSRVAH